MYLLDSIMRWAGGHFATALGVVAGIIVFIGEVVL